LSQITGYRAFSFYGTKVGSDFGEILERNEESDFFVFV
jgi:hypothetical protein